MIDPVVSATLEAVNVLGAPVAPGLTTPAELTVTPASVPLPCNVPPTTVVPDPETVPLTASTAPEETVMPPFDVRVAPLPTVKVPLLAVIAPATLPTPFQLPPVAPNVPVMLPPLAKLILPLLIVA